MSAEHGTYAAWTRHRYAGSTPCDECREAKRIYVAERRRAALAEGGLTHGRRGTYDAGCRCPQCRAARQVDYIRNNGEYVAKRRRLTPIDPSGAS